MAAPRSGKQPSRPTIRTQLRQVNFRLPLDIWERLNALASVRNHSQSRIVSDAVTLFYNSLPATERRLADQLLEHRRKPQNP